MRIDRSGFFRSAIRLPEGTSTSRLSSLSIECLEAGKKIGDQVCGDISIKRVFVLDEKFVPQPVKFEVSERFTLRAGESATATLVGKAS